MRSLIAPVAVLAVAGHAAAQPMPEIGPPVRTDPGGGDEAANETTSAGIGGEFVMGWNDWRLSPPGSEIINTGFALSLDGGATWNDFLIRPPLANQSNVEGDPMTAVDPRTGYMVAGAISFTAGGNSGIYVARKAPGATSFEPAVMARTASGTDKCWMAAGPRPGMPDTTRLYVTYNEGVIWSDDLGLTWTSPNSLGGGLGFNPRVGPDGTLYVCYWDFNTGVLVKRSTNGGLSFSTHLAATRMDVWSVGDTTRTPGTFRVPTLNYLAVDPNDGTLYVLYFDTTSVIGGQYDVDLYFTRSEDQGDTWTTPIVINGDGFPAGDQFFPWIEVDGEGRLHVVFMDSRANPGFDGGTFGLYDAYYAYSMDRGDTWHEFRLTPTSFQCDDDGLDRPNQFLGDYLGLGVDGRVVVPSYLDTSAGDPDIFTNVIMAPLVGDVNGDDVVDFSDVLGVLAAWGPCPGPDPCPADQDGDGDIDFEDLLIVLSRFG